MSLFDRADEGTEFQKAVVHHPFAASIGQKLRAKADKTARRDLKLHARLPVAGWIHHLHLGFFATELFDDGAGAIIGRVDD